MNIYVKLLLFSKEKMNSRKILPLLIYTGRFKTMKTPKFYMDYCILEDFRKYL